VQLYVALSTANLIYLTIVRPFKAEKYNKIEIINEATVNFIGIITFCFTDLVPEAQTRYDIGWVYIFIALLSVLFNISMAGYEGIRDMYYLAKGFILRRNLKRLQQEQKEKSGSKLEIVKEATNEEEDKEENAGFEESKKAEVAVTERNSFEVEGNTNREGYVPTIHMYKQNLDNLDASNNFFHPTPTNSPPYITIE